MRVSVADVSATRDDQKRALLAAVAQQGSAGADTYKQYADSVQAQRQSAVQAAQQRSSVINAGPAALQALQGSAVATSDPYAKDAATGATAYANENARLGTANSNYMDQVKAAIPMMAQVAQGKIDLANAKEKAAHPEQDNPLYRLVQSLGGDSLAKSQLAPMLQGQIDKSTNDAFTSGPTSGWAGIFNILNQNKNAAEANTTEGKSAIIDAAGKSIGLPPGVLQSYLGKQSPDYAAPAKATPLSVQNKDARDKIRTNPSYTKIYSNISTEYANLTAKSNKNRLSAAAAKQKIKSEARSDARYKKYQAIFDQAISDL
jgi:hypothetical protein